MQKQLPDGLILRTLSENHASDREQLPKFYADIFAAENDNEPQWFPAFGNWTHDLMDGHPIVAPDDIFVVVDPAKDDLLVSATTLIPQVWRYEDVQLAVGRPELVATHKDYRSRGLVRAVFEAVHERSAALGHNLLGITGIPHFYRRYGYSMTVPLGPHAGVPFTAIRDLPEDKTPDFTLRLATVDDIPKIAEWNDLFAGERLLSAVRTHDEWRYEMFGRQKESLWEMDYHMIVNAESHPVGFLALRAAKFGNPGVCVGYVVGPESSYLATYNDVMRGMKAWAKNRFGNEVNNLIFEGGIHETIDSLIDRTPYGVIRRREYAWYMRIPDIARFIHDVKPVLERRLAGSGANRYTGELKVGFYNGKGLTIKFDTGCITEASEGAMHPYDADVSFPMNLFFNVVLGYQSCDELLPTFPEIWASQKGKVLLDVLFPKKLSWIMAMA